MSIEVFKTKLDGPLIIRSKIHQDDRGAFYEAFNAQSFANAAHEDKLPQDYQQQNISYSHKGVLRGMHIQKNRPQGKLVRCLAGVIWDCWVDLRKDSPTLGKWESISLGGEEAEAVYIPPGFAHGFFVPSAFALVHYSCTSLYDKTSDGGILWNDPKVGIEWPFPSDFTPMMSGKDANLPGMDEYVERLR